VAVLLAAVLFGTTGTAQALGPDDATPLGVGWLRIAVGAAALAAAGAIVARRQARPPGWRADVGWLVLGGIGVAAYQPTFFTGTDRAGVALGTIVALGSGPAFAGALDAVLFRRRPAASWVRATAIALTGCALLVAAQGGATVVDAVGVAAALAAGASFAVYATAAKVLIVRGMDATVALAAMFVIGAVLLAPLGLAQPLGWATSRDGALMVAHLGIVTVAVAYALYGYGLRSLPTSTAVVLTLAEPVMAAVAGVVVLDEELPALGWIGAAVVVAGLGLGGRAPAPRATPGPVGRSGRDGRAERSEPA
jgi:DME family drug/metabolite transporter